MDELYVVAEVVWKTIEVWLILSGIALLFVVLICWQHRDELDFEEENSIVIRRDGLDFLLDQADLKPMGIYPSATGTVPNDEMHYLMLDLTADWFLRHSPKQWRVRQMIKNRKYLLGIVAYAPGDMRRGVGEAEKILYVPNANGYEGWMFVLRIFTEKGKWVSGITLTVFNKYGEYCGII